MRIGFLHHLFYLFVKGNRVKIVLFVIWVQILRLIFILLIYLGLIIWSNLIVFRYHVASLWLCFIFARLSTWHRRLSLLKYIIQWKTKSWRGFNFLIIFTLIWGWFQSRCTIRSQIEIGRAVYFLRRNLSKRISLKSLVWVFQFGSVKLRLWKVYYLFLFRLIGSFFWFISLWIFFFHTFEILILPWSKHISRI